MQSFIGQQLGNYRLISQLGRGGYAEVYLGEHIYLETQAAIKVLHAKLTETAEIHQFREEARMIARLVHPHIVRVFDFDMRDDVPFLVMDYAPDGTLRRRHHKGEQLPLETILSYVRQVADALQYAHDHELVHRDVKPENMLLGRNGEVLLSDFGNALVAQTTGYQSLQQEVLVGTVAYMAPEQFEGKAYPASDQYALAIVVYEWLSGNTPFHGSITEIAIQHATQPPPPLRNSVPAIPAAVEQVIEKALAKDYHQRFSSVQDFANALEGAAELSYALDAGKPTVRVVKVRDKQARVRTLLPTLEAAVLADLAHLARPQRIKPPSLVALRREKKSLLLPLVFLAMVALICGSSTWLVLDYLPGVISPRLAASQVVIYPNVAGTYAGAINDKTGAITTSMGLSIQQSEGTIGGLFTVGSRLVGSGPFTGAINPAKNLQFTVEGYHGNAPLFFSGSVQSDGSLAGNYCSLDSNAHCNTRTGASGTWKVLKTKAANSGVTPTSTPSPAKTAALTVPADDSPALPHKGHKGHKHHH